MSRSVLLLISLVTGGVLLAERHRAETPVVVPLPVPQSQPAPPARRGELLLFTQAGCPPCDRLKIQLGRANLNGYALREVDLRSDPATAANYRVRSTPTLIRLDSAGKETGRRIGFQTARQITDFLR